MTNKTALGFAADDDDDRDSNVPLNSIRRLAARLRKIELLIEQTGPRSGGVRLFEGGNLRIDDGSINFNDEYDYPGGSWRDSTLRDSKNGKLKLSDSSIGGRRPVPDDKQISRGFLSGSEEVFETGEGLEDHGDGPVGVIGLDKCISDLVGADVGHGLAVDSIELHVVVKRIESGSGDRNSVELGHDSSPSVGSPSDRSDCGCGDQKTTEGDATITVHVKDAAVTSEQIIRLLQAQGQKSDADDDDAQ